MTPDVHSKASGTLKLLWVFDGNRLWVMALEPVTIFSTGNPHALEETHLIRLAHSIGFHAGVGVDFTRANIERAELDKTDSPLINLLIETAQDSGYITLTADGESSQ
jgi:hypothetical protein